MNGADASVATGKVRVAPGFAAMLWASLTVAHCCFGGPYVDQGWTALHQACVRGDVELATMVLTAGTDPHARTYVGPFRAPTSAFP